MLQERLMLNVNNCRQKVLMEREKVKYLFKYVFLCQMHVSGLDNDTQFVRKHNVFKMMKTELKCRILALI